MAGIKDINEVVLIGNVVRNPEIKANEKVNKIARFNIGVNRGGEKGSDFPAIVAFDKTAEIVERFVGKGSKVAVQGRLQTSSYDKPDGTKVYKTEVLASTIVVLNRKDNGSQQHTSDAPEQVTGFQEIDEDIPF